jgi:hypothetical protein
VRGTRIQKEREREKYIREKEGLRMRRTRGTAQWGACSAVQCSAGERMRAGTASTLQATPSYEYREQWAESNAITAH